MNGITNQIGIWLKKNNPLYLLSVVLMLAGLYLAGSELETGNVSGLAVSSFFLIQNLYEIIMVAMALYLLKNKIQPEHGKLLLFFVLLFLGDLTFYQVRISGLSAGAGWIATSVYMLMAIVKIAAVVKILGLTIHRSRLVYAATAFTLIWVAPKIAYMIVDSVGNASLGFFDGTYVFYSLWLIAGLIHLPLIIENWRDNNLSQPCDNEYFGNETTFWRWLIIFPFVVLPLQMAMNVMSDAFSFISPTLPLFAVIAPWILAAAFFAQSLWRHLIAAKSALNICDAVIMIGFFVVVKASSPAAVTPVIINHLLLVAGLLATWLSRGNAVNAAALATLGFWHTGSMAFQGAKSAVSYGTGLSRIAWAGILMSVSFVLLVTGFLFSISRKESDDAQPATGSGEDLKSAEPNPEEPKSEETPPQEPKSDE
ncbi:MAG: hypothetical protein PHD82_02585 [Candidatus Riflebacteria bacterium]|nr:hypothetical protein [Candidatus Riflebacteria bacterium]